MFSAFLARKWLWIIGLNVISLTLTACSVQHEAAHRGLSADGYGFVANGPVLAPPEHLTQHQGPAQH